MKNDPALLAARDVQQTYAPVSALTLRRWVAAGKFPRPVKIERRLYWLPSELKAWLADQTASRTIA